MKRYKHWKQNTPRAQLFTLISSVQGDLLNMDAGITNSEQIPRMLFNLDQVQEILKEMTEGKFDEEVDIEKIPCPKGGFHDFQPVNCAKCGADAYLAVMMAKVEF